MLNFFNAYIMLVLHAEIFLQEQKVSYTSNLAILFHFLDYSKNKTSESIIKLLFLFI